MLAAFLAAVKAEGPGVVPPDVGKTWPDRRLCSAVIREDRAEVLRLVSLSDTAPITSPDKNGRYLLEYCFPATRPDPSAERTADFLRLLAGLGVDLNQRGLESGATALLEKVQGRMGQRETLLALLWAGADPRIPDLKGDLPLHAVVVADSNGFSQDVAEALLSRGADLNARDGGGWLPLHRATFAGRRAEAVRWLLDHGADPNARTSISGMTPLDLYDVRRARWENHFHDPKIDAIESALVGAGGKRLATHPFVLRERLRAAKTPPAPR